MSENRLGVEFLEKTTIKTRSESENINRGKDRDPGIFGILDPDPWLYRRLDPDMSGVYLIGSSIKNC